MAFDLTVTADLLRQKTNIKQQLILEINGIDLLFGAIDVAKIAKYGDEIFFGDVGLVYGGTVSDPRSRPWVMLNGTTNNISQQIDIEDGSTNSVQKINIQLLDKDDQMSKLLQPGNILSDVLGETAQVYLNFIGGAHPEDSIRIMTGIIDKVDFGTGTVRLQISHPEQLKRADLFTQVKMNTTSSINNSQTSIPVTTTENLIPSGNNVTTHVRIGDEIIEVGSIAANSLNGCTRGALGTVADSHNNDAEVTSNYQIEDNPIDLALKLMISQSEEYYDSAKVTAFEQINSTSFFTNAVYIPDLTVQNRSGFVVGDLVRITGAANGANNVVDEQISSVFQNESGTILILGNANLVTEIDADATIEFKSKYNVMPEGAGMSPQFVDVEQFEFLQSLVGSSFPDYDFLLEDTINAKEFLDSQVLFVVGLYSVPRKGRVSCNVTLPPLAINDVTFVNETNVTNADKLKIERTINKRFFNAIVYKYEKDRLEDRFNAGQITVSARSLNRIKSPTKQLLIEANGLRRSGNVENFVASQSRRFQDRYQFAAQKIKTEMLYKDGLKIEVGDAVVFGSEALKITDIEKGNREFEPKLFEVTNKSLNVKTGKVSVELTDTSFSLDGRYGVISPSSIIGSGATTTRIPLQKSFGTGQFEFEQNKWSDYFGQTVLIHNDDWTYQEEQILQGFDPVNQNVAILRDPLSVAPGVDFVMEAPYYTNTDVEETRLWKTLHCSINPTVSVVSGVSQSEFTVSPGDIDRFFVGSVIRVHSEDFATDSSPSTSEFDDLEIIDITGNNITVDRNMGFVPNNTLLVDLIGYRDEGLPYRYI